MSKKQKSIYLEENIIKEIKIIAAKQGVRENDIYTKALQEYLEKSNKEDEKSE